MIMIDNYRRTLLFSSAFLLLVLMIPGGAVAQYKGEPVKRDRLIQVLHSKRFQSRDIVQIIRENGVDFKLTSATSNELVAAGARPPVLDAVRVNYRSDFRVSSGKSSDGRKGGPSADSYGGLLDQAIDAFDVRKDNATANNLLQRAVSLQPANPRAYQLLGFLNLYGYRNFDEAERYWKKSISLGGNAVLRVIHDHSGIFVTSCKGSLYIAKDMVRFESDDNKHTFETSDRNIKEIEVNNKFKRLVQLRSGSFKIVLRDRDEGTKFNFAPLSGKTDESRMIIRLIGKR